MLARGAMTLMDGLRFEERLYDDGRRVETDAVPYVNGRSLIELAAECERSAAAAEGATNLAGDYRGLAAKDVFSPSLHFFGQPKAWRNGVPLLRCVCGEVGCWPLCADVIVGPEVVVWDAFRQPHRPQWSYEGLGPFEFNRVDYDAALRR